ncbi:MAG: Dyp-type peroxidase [Mycobacteriales bacterium]
MTEQLELEDMQGLLVRGYGTLPAATYLLLRIHDVPAARRGLADWADGVTSAERAPAGTALNIALTAAGVAALSPGGRLPAGFSEPFADGMVTPYRSRLLGDVGDDDPVRWAWGGPGEPVSALVLLYAADADTMSGAVAEATRHASGNGMSVVRQLLTEPLSDTEPFGFRDGLSQPTMEGLPRATAGGEAVRAGEFVLGYPNEYGLLTERPLLAPELDPGRLLPPDPAGSGAADLGRNGSYLVLRQLRQDVPAFRDFVDRATGGPDGTADAQAGELFAAKLVGRWRSGAPLTLSPDHDDPALAEVNDFGYHQLDADGLRCPIGAHIRRANPRDSLEPGPGTERSREVNRRHRLLRRGRGYAADGEQGLHFLCLNANLRRQYEFVQHSWVNDPSFNGLVGSADPLVGARGDAGTTFCEPALPVRHRYLGLPRFVHVRGGGYFFLPGIRALRYLASLPDPIPSAPIPTAPIPTAPSPTAR